MGIRRGDIFIANLPSGIGSEQTGLRPVVIIQNDIGNRYSPVVIVASITKQIKRRMPTHIILEGEGGLTEPSLLMLESVYTIDKVRLLKKIGKIKPETLLAMNKAAEISFGLAKDWPFEVTLCNKCREQFKADPSRKIWRADYSQIDKGCCTNCQKDFGYDYFVMRV